MSAAAWAGVAVLGGLGAVVRHLVDGAVAARTSPLLPWGILAVNVSGAFALGALGGRSTVVAVGLLGAYTTFSTWMLQVRVMLVDGRRRGAALYLGSSLVLGLLAVWLGRGLA
ncbi:MAG: fluoride efflux transporter FluC [Solirubrobacteraceae bacterium]